MDRSVIVAACKVTRPDPQTDGRAYVVVVRGDRPQTPGPYIGRHEAHGHVAVRAKNRAGHTGSQLASPRGVVRGGTYVPAGLPRPRAADTGSIAIRRVLPAKQAVLRVRVQYRYTSPRPGRELTIRRDSRRGHDAMYVRPVVS